MNNLNLNIPLSIFSVGAILFLLAPSRLFVSSISHEIFMTGLLIEMIGITTGLIVFYRYKKEFQKPTTDEGFSKVETIKFTRKIDPTFVNKALILDYDSTIRECVGGNGKYPILKEQIKILPNRKEVLQSYLDRGYKLLGMSNQSGIAKGILSEAVAHELFNFTNKNIGIDIEYQFLCLY